MAAAAVIMSRKNRNSRYSNYARSSYDDNGDNPNTCWMITFAFFGVVLFGTGAWYAFDSFDDSRNIAIQPYNKVVDSWNSRDREVFASTVFEWRLVSPGAEKVTIEDCVGEPLNCTKTREVTQYKDVDPGSSDAPWIPMAQALQADSLARDQSMDGIHTYQPLRWVGTGVLPQSAPGHLERGDSGMVVWSGPLYKLQMRARKDGKETVLDVEEIAPMKEVVVAANNKMCRLHHGDNFHDQRCWDRMAVSSVCMRLSYTSDGWVAPKDMSRSCIGNSDLIFSRTCPGSRNQLVGPNTVCDYSNVNFTVRSVDDPYMAAMVMTKNTLNFGYTPHENWVRLAYCLASF